MGDHTQNFLNDLNDATMRAEEHLGGALEEAPVASVSGSTEADPEWAAEMRVKGVAYLLPAEQAKDLGWRMVTPTPGSGNYKFLLTAAIYGNTHEHMEVAQLSIAFDDIPVNGYDKLTMQRVLSKTSGTPTEFVTAWDDKKWYESAAHVSHIADEIATIEKEEGWPVGNLPVQRVKRQAWKFVAVIFNLQRSAGIAFKESSWIGSPAVPEQLLAATQRMLKSKGDLEWECVIPAPWIEVSEVTTARSTRAFAPR